MPRIFRARPAPPVGRSIDIGVTMRPIAPRPAAQLPIVESGVAPAYVGFSLNEVGEVSAMALPPDQGFVDDVLYFGVDFFGTKRDDVVSWAFDDSNDPTNADIVHVSGNLTYGVFGVHVLPLAIFSGVITCTVNGIEYPVAIEVQN